MGWERVRHSEIPRGFSVERARYAQRRIAELVIEEDFVGTHVHRAAGVDVSFRENYAIGVAVVVDRDTFSVIDVSIAKTEVRFPYIPTLLGFRETYPAYKALKGLREEYDVLFVDGNGRLHPYRAGFACQLGLVIDKPTIGVAKSLLIGEIDNWNNDVAPVIYQGETIGVALKTSPRAKPIYVSVGHKISLWKAIQITRDFTRTGLREPEPLRQAHNYSVKARREKC